MANKTSDSCYGLVILAVLCIGCAAWAQSKSDRNPQLVIAVYDDAGVAPDTVLRAETQASHVFQEAGIRVLWRNPLWEAHAELQPVAMLMVRVVPHSRDLEGEIFGLAFLDEDGSGRQADIFYDRIAKLGVHPAQDRAVLLSAVMTHELGHLLLGPHAHTATGIMQARWDDATLRRVAHGLIGFSAEQDARMRARVEEVEGVELNAKVRDERPESATGTQPPTRGAEGVVLRAAR